VPQAQLVQISVQGRPGCTFFSRCAMSMMSSFLQPGLVRRAPATTCLPIWNWRSRSAR